MMVIKLVLINLLGLFHQKFKTHESGGGHRLIIEEELMKQRWHDDGHRSKQLIIRGVQRLQKSKRFTVLCVGVISERDL